MKKIRRKNQKTVIVKIIFVFFFLFFLAFISYIFYTNGFFSWNRKVISPIFPKDQKYTLIELLNSNNFKVDNLLEKENIFEVTLPSGIKVIFASNNLEKQVASLQLMLKRFKIEGRKVTLIDLRFDKPIIK